MEQPKNAISTASGKFFDFNNPQEYAFNIEEIAASLAKLCRFNGHCNNFYSVAEHSVLVSYIVPKHLALCGLLHDASEAYCGDVASPLKALLPDYKRIEKEVQSALAHFYGIPFPFPEDIKTADKQMYRLEREKLCNVADNLWYTEYEPAKVVIHCYDYDYAEAYFLDRFEELTNEQVRAA